MIPNIYEKVRTIIELQIESAESISFTSDIWTSRNNDPYMSLTAHYIDDEFKRKEFVVSCSYFPGAHTGERVGEKITQLLSEANISNDRRHLILRDGGTNYVSGRLSLIYGANSHYLL